MTRKAVVYGALVFAAVTPLLVMVAVIVAFFRFHWPKLATDQAAWGQFGDYIGGVLNPLFAWIAFIGLLVSITIQRRESRAAIGEMLKQTAVAQTGLNDARNERLGEELLHVIRDIDSRIEHLLAIEISDLNSVPCITIDSMVSEAERLATSPEAQSASLGRFVALARSPGSKVEAHVREIIRLVQTLREFLLQYSLLRRAPATSNGSPSYAPLILYYAGKAYRLLHMLEAVGGIPEDTRRFFATISDPHG